MAHRVESPSNLTVGQVPGSRDTEESPKSGEFHVNLLPDDQGIIRMRIARRWNTASRGGELASRSGFTLVELLVVITIIIVLLSVMVPSLNQVKEMALMASCQTGQRQLAIGYTAYASANRGKIMRGEPHAWYPDSFVLNGAGYDPIKKGALYPYAPDVDVFQCPADPSGNERSYSIVGVLRGEDWNAWFQKGGDSLHEVLNPGKQILFAEEADSRDDGEGSYNQGSWLLNCADGSEFRWIDYVGLFHVNMTADNYGFLDGHVQTRYWEDEGTFYAALGPDGQRYTEDEVFYFYDPWNVDWIWLRPYYRQMATKGSVRYIPGRG